MAVFVKPNVFISSCIEFDHCRYDGGIIHSEFVERLLKHVDVTRTCPELAINLGSPREAIRLVKKKDSEEIELLSSIHGNNYTDQMNQYAKTYLMSIQDKQIDGFILKAKSPTCGIKNVKVYYDTGKSQVRAEKADGFFGGKILEMFPGVPIETERRLSNYTIRDRFFTELFTLADFREIKANPSMKQLVAFHSKNKYLFMTYNQLTLRQLGQIVANHDHLPIKDVFDAYEEQLRTLLSKEASQKKRVNVLTHIYGYFKTKVNPEEKEYYFDVLDDYLNHQTTYQNVLTVLLGWAIRFQERYLINQTIFQPYPKDLVVMNDSGKKL